MEIRNKFNSEIIVSEDGDIRTLAEKNKANLRGANLSEANLRGANLSEANLWGAKIAFYQFPSIRFLSSMELGELSDALSLELMRRDAYAHPHPERFDDWAKGGDCPYQNEERFWYFDLKREIWSPGFPQMIDRNLILAICKEKGWGIRDYLKGAE